MMITMEYSRFSLQLRNSGSSYRAKKQGENIDDLLIVDAVNNKTQIFTVVVLKKLKSINGFWLVFVKFLPILFIFKITTPINSLIVFFQ